MTTSPLYLAALAVGALGVEIVSTRQPFVETEDFVSGCVLDSQGRHWMVKVPKNGTAATSLEAEAALAPQLLEELRAGRLPFDIMRPAGFVDADTGGRAVVYPEPFGRALVFEALGEEEVREMGRTLAAIHSIDRDVVARSGLPVYTAAQWRDRVRAELEAADQETSLPTILRQRWMDVLDSDEVWDFEETVVHGDVASDNFLWSNGSVASVLGFGEAHVGDPARDLAAMLVLDDEQWPSFITSYENARSVELAEADYTRIIFTSEFAIIRWLMYGIRTGSMDIRNDAVQMLGALAEDVREAPDLLPAPPASESAFTESASDAEAGGDAELTGETAVTAPDWADPHEAEFPPR